MDNWDSLGNFLKDSPFILTWVLFMSAVITLLLIVAVIGILIAHAPGVGIVIVFMVSTAFATWVYRKTG